MDNDTLPVQWAIAAYEQHRADGQRATYIAQAMAMGTLGSELADQVVCFVREALAMALGLPAGVREIVVSRRQLEHIVSQHGISAKGSMGEVALRLMEALDAPRFRLEEQSPNKWKIIGYSESASRHIYIAVKFVSAAASRSTANELWVSTAFVVGAARMNKYQRSGGLAAIVLEAA